MHRCGLTFVEFESDLNLKDVIIKGNSLCIGLIRCVVMVTVEQNQEVCNISISFPVISSMAPLGRLLVYYMKEDGEGVADSIAFIVKPAYTHKVS